MNLTTYYYLTQSNSASRNSTFKSVGPKVSICFGMGCMSAHSTDDLHMREGTADEEANLSVSQWIFHQDSARPHFAHAATVSFINTGYMCSTLLPGVQICLLL